MKGSFIIIFLYMLPIAAFADAPFCLVNKMGQSQCMYYILEQCQQQARQIGGICAANQQQQQIQTTILPQPVAPKFSPIDASNYIQQQAQLGARQGQHDLIISLRSKALNSNSIAERDFYVRQLIALSPEDGLELAKIFKAQDDAQEDVDISQLNDQTEKEQQIVAQIKEDKKIAREHDEIAAPDDKFICYRDDGTYFYSMYESSACTTPIASRADQN